jgi:hypothetical protein
MFNACPGDAMNDFLRQPTHRYEDPLSRVWIACAERIGFRVERTPHAYASANGRGTIQIANDDMLDPDDSLAQMIFHELCHALVEGEDGEGRQDWGLGNSAGANPWREHACLRLQAYLSDSVGLRDFFAPTTDFRVSFWNSLPADPFAAPPEAGGRRERSCVAARQAVWRASLPRWAPLRQALASSAVIAAATPRTVPAEALAEARSTGEAPVEPMPSLWSEVATPPGRHPAGHATIAWHFVGHGCADCAWSFAERGIRHCRHAAELRVPDDAWACNRWEPAAELDCLTCGACCREAYHAVDVTSREAVNKRHPDMVVVSGGHRKLRREGDRCAALCGGHAPTEAYACSIYADRPRTCRDFTLGSENCLDARRRVGLSL